MASSTFTDTTTVEENSELESSLTIVINENGEIDYDAVALQGLIDSQQSAPVTLVRVGGTQVVSSMADGGSNRRSTRGRSCAMTTSADIDDADTSTVQVTVDNQWPIVSQQANPILLLDQEQITRLENVLKSDEARDLLGEALDTSAVDFGAGLMEMLSSSVAMSNSSAFITTDSSGLAVGASSEDGGSESDNGQLGQGGRNLKPPERRSQRQIEREMKEEADRIKKENQERMKQERELANKAKTEAEVPSVEVDLSQSNVVEMKDLTMTSPKVSATQPARGKKAILIAAVPAAPLLAEPPSRPKRQRKLPAHLQSSDFEYGFGPLAADADAANDKPSAQSSALTTNAAGRKRGPAARKSEPEAIKIDPETETTLFKKAKSEAVKEDDEAVAASEDSDHNDDGENDDEEWDSEDDPERLWCICQRPHQNKFMISCDTCKEWFHGKCVGVTKKMGQEMEAAKILWNCPKCKSGGVGLKEDIDDEFLADVDSEMPTAASAEVTSPLATKKVESSPSTPSKEEVKAKKRRLPKPPGSSSLHRKKSDIFKEPLKKEKTCYECDKLPMASSIFCSDACITKHAARAKARLGGNRPKVSTSSPASSKAVPSTTSKDVTMSHIMVLDPSTNTMLTGPNAPTLATLEDWLKENPNFHVVMPREVPTKKFYGSMPPTKKSSDSHQSKKIKVEVTSAEAKKAEYDAARNSALQGLQAARKHLEESGEVPSKNLMKRSISTTGGSGGPDKEVRKRQRKSSESGHHSTTTPRKDSSSTSPSGSSGFPDPKRIRSNAAKGIREALRVRVSKATDVKKISDEELNKLSTEIEEEMYRVYKNIGQKYMNKYRSLNFNIKDEKNNGLFRKIVNGNISPKKLVAMTPEEMASKELQEWRQAELKHDIEKIKSHELEMIQRGSVVVMKSHKGEQVIEKDDLADSAKPLTDVSLPDDMPTAEINASEKSIEGPKTWQHGNHAFENECDVCTGKKTWDEVLLAKLERQKQEKEERRRKDKEQSHRSGSSSSSSRHHHHHSASSSSKDRHHSSSSSKDRHHTSSSSKDKSSKDRSSSSHKSSSSKSHHNSSSSSSKDRSLSEKSSSKDDRHTSSSSKDHRSSKSDDKHRRHSSSSHHRRHSSSTSKDKSETKKSESPKEEKSLATKEQPQTQFTDLPPEITALLNKFSTPAAVPDIPSAVEAPLVSGEASPQEEYDENAPISPPDDEVYVVPAKTKDEPKAMASSIKSDPKTSTSTSRPEFEVTSTVSIKTPERSAVPENPIVWKGSISMPDVAKFSVIAHQVSGTTDYLTMDLRESLKIVGRISPEQVWDYIGKVKESLNKEVLLIQLRPSTNDEKTSYKEFYKYLKTRNRFGVIDIHHCKMVKDCYIIPLAPKEELNDVLVPIEGPGLDEIREEMLLSLIVRTRRKRPVDTSNTIIRDKSSISKSTKPATAPALASTSADKKRESPPALYKPTPLSSDDIPYDPALAGSAADDLDLISSESSQSKEDDDDEDDEIYDPESAFPDPADKAAKSDKTSTKLKPRSGKLAEELEKLTKEIEAHKKNLKSTPAATDKPVAFQDLPAGIADILFGAAGSSSNSGQATPNDVAQVRDPRKRAAPSAPPAAEKASQSVLSALSDADLLAIAQQQLGDTEEVPASPAEAGIPFTGLPPPKHGFMPMGGTNMMPPTFHPPNAAWPTAEEQRKGGAPGPWGGYESRGDHHGRHDYQDRGGWREHRHREDYGGRGGQRGGYKSRHDDRGRGQGSWNRHHASEDHY